MQVNECLKSSKYLVIALALTASACASTQSSNLSFGNNVAQAADATTTNNESYDSRDATIVVAGNAQSPMDKRLLVLVNKERATAGVKALSFSPQLAKAARQHSAAMATEGFFEHKGDGEPKLFDRVTASGMNTDHVGENIFETSEGASSAVADECVGMWMQSEGHRRNMLSPEFERTGFSMKIASNGENYITEDFAH
ncbi:MAG TPA: CAP domain-containing protein [Candidatus Binataceae bacterium]|nr:CAP domain-containing protein [Candidatus Binataceae bacterium]